MTGPQLLQLGQLVHVLRVQRAQLRGAGVQLAGQPVALLGGQRVACGTGIGVQPCHLVQFGQQSGVLFGEQRLGCSARAVWTGRLRLVLLLLQLLAGQQIAVRLQPPDLGVRIERLLLGAGRRHGQLRL